MFAPRCRGQIAARTNGRLVLQGTASCLPSGTPRVHTHTYIHTSYIYTHRHAHIEYKYRADRARFHADPERSYPGVDYPPFGSLRPFACTEHFLWQDRQVTKGMRFRNTPGETYCTSGVLTSSSCLSELMGLINVYVSPYSLHPSTLLFHNE